MPIASAQIVEVNTSTNEDYSGTSSSSLTSDTVSLTAGNSIIVAITWALDNQSVSSISDTASNSYSLIIAHDNGSDQWVELWAATDTAGNASNQLTITMSGTVRYWAVNTVQYSGLETSSVANMVDLTSTGTQAANATVTSSAWGPTTQADEVLLAAVRISNNGSSFTADTGYAVAVEDTQPSSAIETQIVSAIQSGGANTVSMTYGSSTSWVLAFVALKASGGGGGGGAITEINSSLGEDFTGTTATSLTSTAASLTAGNANIVGITFYANQTISGCTDTAGNTYTQVVSFSDALNQRAAIYAVTDALGHASNVVTCTTSGNVAYWVVHTVQYSGLEVDSVAAMVDVTSSGESGFGTTGTTPGWGPTTTADELLFCVVRVSTNNGAFTEQMGYTITSEDTNVHSAVQTQIVAAIQPSGANVCTMSYSTSTFWSLAFASFRQDGEGEPPPSSVARRLLLLGVGR